MKLSLIVLAMAAMKAQNIIEPQEEVSTAAPETSTQETHGVTEGEKEWDGAVPEQVNFDLDGSVDVVLPPGAAKDPTEVDPADLPFDNFTPEPVPSEDPTLANKEAPAPEATPEQKAEIAKNTEECNKLYQKRQFLETSADFENMDEDEVGKIYDQIFEIDNELAKKCVP